MKLAVYRYFKLCGSNYLCGAWDQLRPAPALWVVALPVCAFGPHIEPRYSVVFRTQKNYQRMSDRPSDAMQPNSKRRAGSQGGKDDADDDEDESGQDPGSWQPDPDVIAKRRKIKVRRAGEEAVAPPASATTTAAAAGVAPPSANPFAGISLAAPTAAAPAAFANPFASISLVAPAPAAAIAEVRILHCFPQSDHRSPPMHAAQI